jgi:hypothetical protein
MSRTSVRRLTAGIVLLAVLCLALPGAAAAAPVRPHAAKAPAVSLLDQFLTWVRSFLPEQKPQTKTIGLPVGPIDLNGAKSSNADSNTAIDPNG